MQQSQTWYKHVSDKGHAFRAKQVRQLDATQRICQDPHALHPQKQLTLENTSMVS